MPIYLDGKTQADDEMHERCIHSSLPNFGFSFISDKSIVIFNATALLMPIILVDGGESDDLTGQQDQIEESSECVFLPPSLFAM